jgi:hypothetical protein
VRPRGRQVQSRFCPRALFAPSPLLPRVVPAVWGGMRQMREQTRHAADWRGPGQKLPRCSSPRRARQSRIDSGCSCTAGGQHERNHHRALTSALLPLADAARCRARRWRTTGSAL